MSCYDGLTAGVGAKVQFEPLEWVRLEAGVSGGLIVVAWLTSMIEGIILLLIATSPTRDIMDGDGLEELAIEPSA